LSNKSGTPLGDAIEHYFQRQGIKRRMEQASVVPEWSELVGEKIAAVTTPREVRRDGTLVVAVKSAAWMQELQLMEPTIRAQLIKGGKKIRRIVWRGDWEG
jgi:predicted nucleic acid-binding Zn ribbon protein